MAQSIEQKLSEMGVVLPTPSAPAASYVPTVATGSLLFTAGQLPLENGKLVATGLVGRDLDVSAGQAAARMCAINVLAQLKAAIGDLEKIARLVKITCFVASAPGFTEQHIVANGASDFFIAALGERGKHARSAVGMASLPLDAPVEVEAIVELR
jgi:enamine deaminase RidA (YjgF/YER057c/UK114 family)